MPFQPRTRPQFRGGDFEERNCPNLTPDAARERGECQYTIGYTSACRGGDGLETAVWRRRRIGSTNISPRERSASSMGWSAVRVPCPRWNWLLSTLGFEGSMLSKKGLRTSPNRNSAEFRGSPRCTCWPTSERLLTRTSNRARFYSLLDGDPIGRHPVHRRFAQPQLTISAASSVRGLFISRLGAGPRRL